MLFAVCFNLKYRYGSKGPLQYHCEAFQNVDVWNKFSWKRTDLAQPTLNLLFVPEAAKRSFFPTCLSTTTLSGPIK